MKLLPRDGGRAGVPKRWVDEDVAVDRASIDRALWWFHLACLVLGLGLAVAYWWWMGAF